MVLIIPVFNTIFINVSWHALTWGVKKSTLEDASSGVLWRYSRFLCKIFTYQPILAQGRLQKKSEFKYIDELYKKLGHFQPNLAQSIIGQMGFILKQIRTSLFISFFSQCYVRNCCSDEQCCPLASCFTSLWIVWIW